MATSFDAGCFLFHNLGNGKFEDASEKAEVRNTHRAYTAEFLDYDNDGRADLFVSTYPDGDIKGMIANYTAGVGMPSSQQQLLFHNNGDGTFTNGTEKSGHNGMVWGDVVTSGRSR